MRRPLSWSRSSCPSRRLRLPLTARLLMHPKLKYGSGPEDHRGCAIRKECHVMTKQQGTRRTRRAPGWAEPEEPPTAGACGSGTGQVRDWTSCWTRASASGACMYWSMRGRVGGWLGPTRGIRALSSSVPDWAWRSWAMWLGAGPRLPVACGPEWHSAVRAYRGAQLGCQLSTRVVSALRVGSVVGPSW